MEFPPGAVCEFLRILQDNFQQPHGNSSRCSREIFKCLLVDSWTFRDNFSYQAASSRNQAFSKEISQDFPGNYSKNTPEPPPGFPWALFQDNHMISPEIHLLLFMGIPSGFSWNFTSSFLKPPAAPRKFIHKFLNISPEIAPEFSCKLIVEFLNQFSRSYPKIVPWKFLQKLPSSNFSLTIHPEFSKIFLKKFPVNSTSMFMGIVLGASWEFILEFLVNSSSNFTCIFPAVPREFSQGFSLSSSSLPSVLSPTAPRQYFNEFYGNFFWNFPAKRP